jgi:hypothetical protein
VAFSMARGSMLRHYRGEVSGDPVVSMDSVGEMPEPVNSIYEQRIKLVRISVCLHDKIM